MKTILTRFRNLITSHSRPRNVLAYSTSHRPVIRRCRSSRSSRLSSGAGSLTFRIRMA